MKSILTEIVLSGAAIVFWAVALPGALIVFPSIALWRKTASAFGVADAERVKSSPLPA